MMSPFTGFDGGQLAPPAEFHDNAEKFVFEDTVAGLEVQVCPTANSDAHTAKINKKVVFISQASQQLYQKYTKIKNIVVSSIDTSTTKKVITSIIYCISAIYVA
jgi:hypothetical protein